VTNSENYVQQLKWPQLTQHKNNNNECPTVANP